MSATQQESDSNASPHDVDEGWAAPTDVDALLERNRRAARGHAGPLSPLPTLGLIVLTCADPRVDPAHFLGLQPGEAVVLRAPAGRFTPAVVRALLGLAVVNPRVLHEQGRAGDPPRSAHLMIVHHTDCGVIRLNRPQDVALLSQVFEVPEEAVASRAFSDPETAVAVDVEEATRLVAPSGTTVSGHVYDVSTGLLRTVVR